MSGTMFPEPSGLAVVVVGQSLFGRVSAQVDKMLYAEGREKGLRGGPYGLPSSEPTMLVLPWPVLLEDIVDTRAGRTVWEIYTQNVCPRVPVGVICHKALGIPFLQALETGP